LSRFRKTAGVGADVTTCGRLFH